MTPPAPSLHALHAPGRLLFLPCVWDATSARLFAQQPGVRALGTSSAAVAAAHGLGDGEQLPLADLLHTVDAILGATTLPLSVDLERGYADRAEGVYAVVGELVARGVCGINLEDARGDGTLAGPAEHAQRLAAARQAARDAKKPLFINARTDVWWRPGPGMPGQRYAEGAARLRRYIAGGADGVFAPGYPEPGTEDTALAIRQLVDAVADAPLNLLLRPGLPPLPELARLGVRRVSTGSVLYRLALAQARAVYREIACGAATTAAAAAEQLPYAELARLLPADRPT